MYSSIIYEGQFSNFSLQVTGLAVDWQGGNLYWADEGLEAILVSRLDGNLGQRPRATVISGNLSLPRSLAVDPTSGFLFWSNWKTSESRVGSIR